MAISLTEFTCHIQQVIMGKELTRREFLKESVSKTALFSVTGLGLNGGMQAVLKKTVRCANCSTLNLLPQPYLSSFIYPGSQFCDNCGINIDTLKYDMSCGNSRCKSTNINNNRGNSPACCQVPFPNHISLINSKKPNFSLSKCKF